MNVRTLIALVVGIAVSFLLTWLVSDKLLAGFYSQYSIYYPGIVKNPPVLWAKVLGHAFWVALIIFVLMRSDDRRTFFGGLLVGAVLGFLVNAGYDSFFYGGWNLFARRVLLVHIATTTVLSGITGSVIGAIIKE